MRRYLYSIVVAFAFFIVVLPTSTKAQQVCQSLGEVAQEFSRVGVTKEMVFSKRDPEFARAYLKEIGLAVPADSDPIGITILRGPKGAVAGLVEGEFCVKHWIFVPLGTHDRAMKALFRSA